MTGPAASYDPTAGMLRAAAAFLHGKSFPHADTPSALRPLLRLGQSLWRSLPFAGAPEVIDSEAAADMEDAAATARYPRHRYPAVAMGASNGALLHLCAALGIPWLPQTFRHGLGTAYKIFLARCLPAGSTILVVDCTKSRPVPPLGEHPVFQHGAAEWGYAPEQLEDLHDFARRHNLAVVRLGFNDPEDLSPLVADLYAWWYRRRAVAARRLLATSFIAADPLWTFRIGAVPFWLEFVREASAAHLERYLEARPPFDYISLALFQPSRQAIAQPPLERWQSLLIRARRRGDFIGTVAASPPEEASNLARYEAAIKRIPARYPVPPPLPLVEFGGFLRYAGRYRVAVQPVNGAALWLG